MLTLEKKDKRQSGFQKFLNLLPYVPRDGAEIHLSKRIFVDFVPRLKRVYRIVGFKRIAQMIQIGRILRSLLKTDEV